MKATLNYDGRNLKGLSDVVLGPIFGTDGKPLLNDADRDSDGMTLIDDDTKQGHRLCLVRAQAPDRALSLYRGPIRAADRDHPHAARDEGNDCQ